MAEVQRLEGKVLIERKSFEKDGESFTYFDVSMNVDGQTIKLSIKQDYKKLAEFLFNSKLKG